MRGPEVDTGHETTVLYFLHLPLDLRKNGTVSPATMSGFSDPRSVFVFLSGPEVTFFLEMNLLPAPFKW